MVSPVSPAAPVVDAVTARAQRIARTLDPAPSSIERGPVARMHWRHDVNAHADLASVVDPGDPATGGMSAEWPALLAETHARLLDPAGVRDLARPSPVGAAVGAALEKHEGWQAIADAAALHPSIARDAVISLADVVRNALSKAGAAKTDTRRTLADLDAARAALEKARAALAKDPTDREKQRANVEAGKATERAEGTAQSADAMGSRMADALDGDEVGEAIGRIAAEAEERADGLRALAIAGIGSAIGSTDTEALPDDVVDLLSPHVAAMLREVGALRLALREGRASRHLPGREGMLGPDIGGLDRVGDLTPLARAGLAGLLGPGLASVERLRLVQGRASVVEKGGGKANKGDVVVVLDKSGSMRGARETWASALALAVVLEARAEHRTCAVVTYNGDVLAEVIVDGPVGMREALAAICRVSGGDNNERAALKAAGRCLGRMRKGGDPADVLMLTDGQWHASNLDGSGIDKARLRACFIGGSAPTGAAFASTWEILSVDSGDEGAARVDAVTIARTVV